MINFDRISWRGALLSAYDSKRTLADANPFQRGINSIQLLNDGTRWWIVSVYRHTERPETPIPARYLKPPAAVY